MFNKLSILSIITVAVIIAATIFVNLRAPQSEIDKPPFFPGLADRIADVQHISIKGYAENINLSLKNNVWGIDEFDGYPALPDKVKSAVLGAAELKINAPKTKMERLYHRLGVEGPEVEDTTSLFLALKDNNNENIVEVIVGKPRRSSAAQNSPGLYVRKPDDEQSYLVDGVLDITAIKTEWIDRSIFDIPSEGIQSVQITHSDGDTFKLFKSDKGQELFDYENIPAGKKLGPEILINRFGTILEDMQISAARSADKFVMPSDTIKVIIKTFNGILVNMTAFEVDDIPYATFDFNFDESQLVDNNDKEKSTDIKQYVEHVQGKAKGWIFEIPGFKYDIVNKRSDRVLRDDHSFEMDEDE